MSLGVVMGRKSRDSVETGEPEAGEEREERRFSILSAVIEQVKSDDNEDGAQPSQPSPLQRVTINSVKYSPTAKLVHTAAILYHPPSTRLNLNLPTQKVY